MTASGPEIGLVGQDLMRNVYVIIGSAMVALLPRSVKRPAPPRPKY